jgi:hypothetical protein
MRDEMHVGVDFLKLMLERYGRDAVIQCVERLNKELKDGSPLEEYDFLDKTDGPIDELALLSKAQRRSLNLTDRKTRMTRRDFFETVGWSALATFWAGSGGIHTGDDIASQLNLRPKEKHAGQSTISRIAEHGEGPADILLSVTVSHYVAGYWQKMKLEHVANAIDEMAKHLPPPKPSLDR